MSKLLNKPLKAFALYALVILLCSIPAYYVVVDYIWLKELDENNQIVRVRIEKGFADTPITKDKLESILTAWNDIQPGTKITKATRADIRADSIYTQSKVNRYAADNEINRFRTLSAYIDINGEPYHLTVETNVEETDETVMAIALVTFLFFILLVSGFIILNRMLSIGLWKPFSSTLETLKTFDLNKQQRPQFEKSGIEEFEALNRVAAKLIDNNIAAYTQQKEFAENASHELQTPLALLKSKLDLLIQDEQLNAKQKEQIAALNLPLARVSRINKNLLLLAKIENHQFDEKEAIDLSTTVNDNLEIFASHFAEKGITIEQNIAQHIKINSNANLIEILLTNLLVNALRHSQNNGSLSITLQQGVLRMANSGDTALNTDLLFKRFQTSSRTAPSSGLGLSIIKEICNRYGWQIAYNFENNQHVFYWRF